MAAFELFIHPRIARFQFRFGRVQVLAGQPRIEQWNKPFVNLRRQKTQPLMQPIAVQRAIGRSQSRLGLLVSQVLHNRRAFPKAGAIVQFKNWHVTQGIHIVKINGAVHRVCAVIDLEQRDIKPQFIDHDMRGKGTTARDVVKLHARSPNGVCCITSVRKVLKDHLRDVVYKWKKALFYHLGT
ncbi:hypothetical protein D3C85_1042640 [compost metagenome]